MDPSHQHYISVVVSRASKPSLKRSHSDMRRLEAPLKWIDEEYYRRHVLRIPAGTNEKEIDWNLKQEADEYGIAQSPAATDIDTLTSLLSTTTVASDPTTQSSAMSQSTEATSRSSSEPRPPTRDVNEEEEVVTTLSATPSMLSEVDKKRPSSGFRNSIRKMTGFSRKRKSTHVQPIRVPSVDSRDSGIDLVQTPQDSEHPSTDIVFKVVSTGSAVHNSAHRSASIRSSGSSNSQLSRSPKLVASHFQPKIDEVLIDHDALRRSMECDDIVTLRAQQLDGRQRFLDYQTQMVSDLCRQRDDIKREKSRHHRQMVVEQSTKNEKSIEGLESRQLEDEMRVRKEHEHEKRAILARLRHMEAYCQNPSPPPTPIEPTSSTSGSDRSSSSFPRGSVDSISQALVLPERKVTDKDYHNLASCYRERDAMDNLHIAKINVLRGKQKRAVESLVLKKEKEIDVLEDRQQKELDEIDREFQVLEDSIKAEFEAKRRVLEKRWKLQAMIMKAKMERTTGLRYESLPYVTASESQTDQIAATNAASETTGTEATSAEEEK